VRTWLFERAAELAVMVIAVAAGIAFVAWCANLSIAAMRQASKVFEL
jgi:hypothetical protein